MRDPARVDRVLELVRELWEESPDLRLCQLLSAAARLSGWQSMDVFYLEDDRLELALEEWRRRTER